MGAAGGGLSGRERDRSVTLRLVRRGLVCLCVCLRPQCVLVVYFEGHRAEPLTGLLQRAPTVMDLDYAVPRKLRSRSLLKLSLRQPTAQGSKGRRQYMRDRQTQSTGRLLVAGAQLSPSVLDEIVAPRRMRSSCIRPPPAKHANIGRRNPLQRRAPSLILRSLARARVSPD